jgi:hypothetical protein
MSFFQYCDKLVGFIGFANVLKNVERIYNEFYLPYKTVGECADALSKK